MELCTFDNASLEAGISFITEHMYRRIASLVHVAQFIMTLFKELGVMFSSKRRTTSARCDQSGRAAG
jgi:hypothetical protein